MRSLFFLWIMFCSGFLFSQESRKDIEAVLELMKSQEASWNQGDIPAFMEHYWKNDSLKFVSSGGVTYGWQTTIGNYLKSYPTKEAMGTLKFSIIEASQLSPAGIFIVGKWELLKEKPAGGHFTLLWKKIEGKWVIVTDHTS